MPGSGGPERIKHAPKNSHADDQSDSDTGVRRAGDNLSALGARRLPTEPWRAAPQRRALRGPSERPPSSSESPNLRSPHGHTPDDPHGDAANLVQLMRRPVERKFLVFRTDHWLGSPGPGPCLWRAPALLKSAATCGVGAGGAANERGAPALGCPSSGDDGQRLWCTLVSTCGTVTCGPI